MKFSNTSVLSCLIVGSKACFEIGHTTDAVTKGIWVMCRPHPIKKNEVLVLLDTEGIDDPDKVIQDIYV